VAIKHLSGLNNLLCFAENQPVMNGVIASSECVSSDICDSADDKTVIGPKPSAERCRLSGTGDQLQTDVDIPLSATSPVSENVAECASLSGHEDCNAVGMCDSDVKCIQLNVQNVHFLQ